jgi:hypothetical protein
VKRRRRQDQQRIDVSLDITDGEVETVSATSQFPKPDAPH